VKTTWGREHIKIVISVTCLSDVLREHMKRHDKSTFFVSQRTGIVLGPFGPI